MAKYEIWMMCTMGECEPMEPFIKEFEGGDIEEALRSLDECNRRGDGTYQLYTHEEQA